MTENMTTKTNETTTAAAAAMVADMTLTDASRADYNASILYGYRYSVRRYIEAMQRLDDIDTELETLGCRAITYDRVVAGRSSVPNRLDPGQQILDAGEDKRKLELQASFWASEMEKSHRIIRDLMRTTDPATVDMILRYYDRHETYRDIADRYGTSIYYVRNHMRRALADV